MSWWDSAGLTNLAQHAIKSAQKKIDKVLDIADEGQSGGTPVTSASASAPDSPVKEVASPKEKQTEQDSFWNTWFDSGDTPSSEPPKTQTSPQAKLSGSPTLESTSAKRSAGVRSKSRTLLGGTRSSSSAVSTLRSDSEASASESEQMVLRTSGSLSSIVSESGSSSDSQASVIKSPSVEELEPSSPRSTVAKKGAPLKLISRSSAKLKDDAKKEGRNVEVEAGDTGDEHGKTVQTSEQGEVSSDAPPVPPSGHLSSDVPVVEPSTPVSVVSADVQLSSESAADPVYIDTVPDSSLVLQLTVDSSNSVVTEKQLRTVTKASGQLDSGVNNETGTVSVTTLSVSSENVKDEVKHVDGIERAVGADHTAMPSMQETEGQLLGEEESQFAQKNDASTSFIRGPSMSDSAAWSDSKLPEMEDSSAWGDSQLPEMEDSVVHDEAELQETKTAALMEAVVTEHSKLSDAVSEEQKQKLDSDESADASNVTDLPEVHETAAAWGDSSLPEIPEVEEDLSLTPQQEVVPSFPPSEGDVLQAGAEQHSVESISDELSESNRTLTSDDFTDGAKIEIPSNSGQREIAVVEPEDDSTRMVQNVITEEAASADSSQNQAAQAAESGDAMTVSSSSSIIVKTMIEDAMTESLKDTDTHSCGSSDKSSEMVRIESGLNSGHTSGDEIDTTTSSDIEIISTPTPNGSDRDRIERPFDLSPLRHALSRTVRRGSPPGHKRSDSSSSGQSTWSKNGDDLIGSPDGTLHVHGSEQEASGDTSHCQPSHSAPHHHHRQQRTSESELQSGGNPMETEKLLKDSDGLVAPGTESTTTLPNLDTILESGEATAPQEVEVPSTATVAASDNMHESVMVAGKEPFQASALMEKLAEMAEVLDAREKKLLELSRENIDLHEGNTILRNQLQQSEEAHEAEMTDLNAVTEEFAVRISESEKKLHGSIKERDHLKMQLQETEALLAKRSDSSNATEKLLQEKDQQISELLEEGEKLSKQQLQANNIIKKLRAKEKETDGTIKSQTQKLETQKKELEHLKKVLDSKEDLEKRQVEAIGQLNNAVKKQESEMARLKGEQEDALEKIRSLEAALDKSYKELGDLHKANASKQSEAMEQALSAELQAKEELRLMYDQAQQQFRQEHEALINQIEDLRISLSRQEKEHGRREDVLRQEIADLQQRLQEAEDRNQDLTQSVTAATRPLLRQIENLQSTYGAQSASYEKVETNLTTRLAEAQTQLAAAVEKERAASEKVIEVSTRLTTLESQVTLLRQEKSRLMAELEMERTKLEILEDAKNNETAQLNTLKQNYEKELADLKREKVLLEGQLEMEKMRTETERKKFALAQDQLNEKDYLLQSQQQKRMSSTPSPRSTPRPSSRSSSVDPMSESFTQEEILEKTLMMASSNGSKPSLYDALRATGAATVMENLQSQLKMREGEIVQLQSEIHELERTREAMARELVNLTTQNEELREQVEEFPALQQKYKDMDNRYQALLQMYGEKVEETDELRLDLQDVKDMYKGQIEMLLKNR